MCKRVQHPSVPASQPAACPVNVTGAEAASSTGVLTSRRSHYRDDEGHAFTLYDNPNDFTRSGWFESGTAYRFSCQGSGIRWIPFEIIPASHVTFGSVPRRAPLHTCG